MELMRIEDVLGVFVPEGVEKERVGTATAEKSALTPVVSSLISADHAHDELSEPTGTIPFSFPDKPEVIIPSDLPDSASSSPTPTFSPVTTTPRVIIGYTSTMGTNSTLYGPPDTWYHSPEYRGSQSWQATRSAATYTASIYDTSMDTGEARPVRGLSRNLVAGVCCGMACNVALCVSVYAGLRRNWKRMRRGVRGSLREKKKVE
jgi:hypothetical protein